VALLASFRVLFVGTTSFHFLSPLHFGTIHSSRQPNPPLARPFLHVIFCVSGSVRTANRGHEAGRP
jgi:hypothetical protein